MDENWDALAAAIKRRRQLLKLSQVELAELVHVSRSTIQKLEWATGQGTSRRTLAGLERALSWESGSINAILGGGEPMLRQYALVGTEKDGQGNTVELHVSNLRGAAREGILKTIKNATAEQVLAAEQEIIDILRKQGVLPAEADDE